MRIRKLDLDLVPQLNAKELRAKRRVLSKTLEGSWTTLLKGRGMEFAGFRQYTYGDDASRIDWGASLRSKETLIREFEEYRSVTVLFLIDVSDTMMFTSQKKLKCEYAAELAFNLGVAILENGDAVGHTMFANGVISRSMPAIGRKVITGMAASLSNPRNYGGRKDFAKVVNQVNALLKQRALIVLISDFFEMGEDWERYVRQLAVKFDLIGIMLRDPREREFPDLAGQFYLAGASGNERLAVDVKQYRTSYNRLTREDEAHIAGVFAASHAGFVALTTGGDLLPPIIQYFHRRTGVIKG